MIAEYHPDIIFLDIQMPEMTGLEMLQHIDAVTEKRPLIIFTTAYDEYALQAFELHAVDYLLKPFSLERFKTAVDQVISISSNSDQNTKQLQSLIDQIKTENTSSTASRITVKDAGKLSFVDIASITWVEASGNYVELHTADTKHLMRETLTNIKAKLPSKDFFQASRSVIININFVKNVVSNSKREVFINTTTGDTLKTTLTLKEVQARLES